MKVLVSAYACEPDKGSEPGVGWNWILAASRRHELCVLTRANNRGPIEAALAASPVPSLRFVYLDLPRWARFWKRGERGIFLYYTLWQLLAGRVARRLCRREHFDVVHHLTFANVWLPALATLAGPPVVLGPASGAQRVPLRLYPALGLRGVVRELLRSVRFANRLNPLARVGWNHSTVILVNNRETGRSLPRRLQSRIRVRSQACVVSVPVRRELPGEPRLAGYAGRLVPWKGLALAIRALEHAPGWQLLVIGSGDDVPRLQRIARRHGVSDRVRFEGPLPQEETWRRLARCQALVVPSLKEGASMIATEAQTIGLPVVALAANGPAVLAETPGAHFALVPTGSVDDVVRGLAAALRGLDEPAPTAERPDFGLDAVERDVDAAYRAAVTAAVPASREAAA